MSHHPIHTHIEIPSEEEWRDTHAPSYQVSSHGRVRTLGRTITQISVRNGIRMKFQRTFKPRMLKRTAGDYWVVHMGTSYVECAHRLVLEAFVGPCPEGMECRHLDDDRTNDRLENLAWGTRSENIEDRRINGIDSLQRGEGSHYAKLTEKEVRSIREEYAAGGISQNKLGKKFGVNQITISQIVTRKTWKHVI